MRVMREDRERYGPLVATVGAALLAVSVFMPWYAVTLTASGAASAQKALNGVAQQYGNSTFQSAASTLGAGFNSLAGQQLGTLSAHDALKYINVVLLILAGIAFFASVLRLAGVSAASAPYRSQIALVGGVATLCVLFRMIDRPDPVESVLSLSLDWGIWLALCSSAAIVAGGMWPRRAISPEATSGTLEKAWDGLSGWTPGS